MTLTSGIRLGPYEVVALIGEGGMGQVYQATDTKLKRQVAIKILPPSVATDHERLARFQREAEVLASLNHPNIAAIYGLEESDVAKALVMELVEGPTLADRFFRGPIPLDEALPIARQIAEALEAAHEQGIIHRDLKPANVKVRPDGTVKVLDFGLAKAIEPISTSTASAAQAGDLANSPTITGPAATAMGMILGTAAYMSPEQARGRPVDKRTDIWAFGVVLYEMLTGKRLFSGEDVSDTMAAVLRQTIALGALPEQTPASVRALIERCLERDARLRLRDIGEARLSLDRMLPPPGASEAAVGSTRHPSLSVSRMLLPWLLFTMVAAALLAVLALGRWSTASSPPSVRRFSVGIGVPGSLAVDAGPAAVLSPDGRTIVLRVRHEGTTRLYARRLDQLAPVELAGSELGANPFFSPDGTQVGFFASGGLKTMPLAGGAVTTLTDAQTGRGAAWDENGDILFQPSMLMKTPLVRITASSASIGIGTTLAVDEVTHRWPQILPGRRVLYSAHSDVSNWDTGALRIETTPGEPGKVVLRGGYHGRYVATGHLLYVHAGTLYGIRFDLDRLETTSSPVPVIEHIAATPISGSAQYSFASDGTLVYIQGSSPSADARIHWLTPRGETSALKTMPGTWASPRFSPDGKRIALQVAYGSHDQISVYDLASDRLTQLTFDAANHRAPIWTSDGQRIVYTSDASGAESQNLYSRPADGSGAADRLTTSPGRQVPYGVHPSGRYLLYSETQGQAPSILWMLPLNGNAEKGLAAGKPEPFSNGATFEALGAFSPDGRLVAYMSSAQGPFEIYVRPFEGVGGPWRVSTSGGAHPVFSRSANELLFTTEEHVMTSRYRYDGKTFTSETPRPWSPVRYATAGPIRKFDLHPDGTRAVVAGPDTTGATPYDTVVFVQNFFDELRRLLPAGR